MCCRFVFVSVWFVFVCDGFVLCLMRVCLLCVVCVLLSLF